jgi:ATP/maltotriose-dependent transcriptional regulator MalT
VSEGEAAERLYREAIDQLGRCRGAVALARAHLVYGEWLRRENRRADARAQLRTAYDMFARMGAEAFAERARGELFATGETIRKRAADVPDELTAQERQIARRARDGQSNPEIGAELFLSPRTVEARPGTPSPAGLSPSPTGRSVPDRDRITGGQDRAVRRAGA